MHTIKTSSSYRGRLRTYWARDDRGRGSITGATFAAWMPLVCGVLLLVGSSKSLLAQATSPLRWSHYPGAFEQHLQRRHRNPLFPANRRVVSQPDIDAAKARDWQDYEALKARMTRLADDISNLPSEISSSQVNALRERMDVLMQGAVGVGGPADQIASRLKEVRQTLIRSWRAAAAGNPEVLGRLDEAEQFWQANVARFTLPFVAQLLRTGGPIPPEEVLPALLSEEPATIAAIMHWINDPQERGRIQAEAAAILKSALAAGAAIDQFDEKVRALGLPTK